MQKSIFFDYYIDNILLYYLFVDSRIRSILPWNFVGNWTRHFIFLGGQNGDDGIDIDGKTSI